MRDSDLIQDENYILHMLVQNNHPEVGSFGVLPLETLNRTVDWEVLPKKGLPVIHCGGRGREKHWICCGSGTSLPNVLYLHVGVQGLSYLILSAFCANEPMSLPQSM